MELTPENQDDMDCRPLGRETGIETPDWLAKILAAHRATSKKPTESLPSDQAE